MLIPLEVDFRGNGELVKPIPREIRSTSLLIMLLCPGDSRQFCAYETTRRTCDARVLSRDGCANSKNMEGAGAGFGAAHATGTGDLLESEMELGNHSVLSSSEWNCESDRESELSSYGSDQFASESQSSGVTAPCNNGMLRLVTSAGSDCYI